MTEEKSNKTQSGLFLKQLFIGNVSDIKQDEVVCTVTNQQIHTGVHYDGTRHGLGEVGEYIVVQSQEVALLGRINEVSALRDDVAKLRHDPYRIDTVSAQATMQILGSIAQDSLEITAGMSSSPRIGDSVYSLPIKFIGEIPTRIKGINDTNPNSNQALVTLTLGTIKGTQTEMQLRPEEIFSRHCAILGMTGSGKSWTLEHLLEELQRYSGSKTILVDSTGEYKTCSVSEDLKNTVEWYHTPDEDSESISANEVLFSATNFSSYDYLSLFTPSAAIQAPVLRDAIQSLRILKCLQTMEKPPKNLDKIIDPSILDNAKTIDKDGKEPADFAELTEDPAVSKYLANTFADFDLNALQLQIKAECVESKEGTAWKRSKNALNQCQSLLMRVDEIIRSNRFALNISDKTNCNFDSIVDKFLSDTNTNNLFVIDISAMDASGEARPVIVNAIANSLMKRAKERKLINADKPLLLFIDEAHNFIGKNMDSQEVALPLQGIENIAREGRKYGLNLCLATQRPRDLSGATLSQMGTMIVHRLINDGDRKAIENASGAASNASLRFLPDLQPGEALILGTDIPIPLDVNIASPLRRPQSQSSHYQTALSEKNN
ncbi:ATP-binding protein [Bifidobacterium sp. ESL0769]|uniref:ATP-binding protein n=1 Tax=Bifidobacterium sp. ESL0769 TaxID=2983229 RepID=UPI0023F6E680|nr:ATP-binding protein [Bifidobacterium sp. ESL0769]WEV67943.1 ATP-binding protein [Bifidobacterium sp. ESL0769]